MQSFALANSFIYFQKCAHYRVLNLCSILSLEVKIAKNTLLDSYSKHKSNAILPGNKLNLSIANNTTIGDNTMHVTILSRCWLSYAAIGMLVACISRGETDSL